MATDHKTMYLDSSDSREIQAPPLDSSSTPPPLFNGTTRLYITYRSPYAQRVWVTRNLKGLRNQIKLVPLSLTDKPAWYREKVYPIDKVPSLEHNHKVMGESLDLMRYIDQNFEGPPLFPTDLEKREFGEELWSYSLNFNETLYKALEGKKIEELDPSLDHLEAVLHKFHEGPFFLGQLSLVDIAYIPLLERLQLLLLDVWKHDITAGRPKLAAWMEEMDKIEAYTQTKYDPQENINHLKRRFSIQL